MLGLKQKRISVDSLTNCSAYWDAGIGIFLMLRSCFQKLQEDIVQGQETLEMTSSELLLWRMYLPNLICDFRGISWFLFYFSSS